MYLPKKIHILLLLLLLTIY